MVLNKINKNFFIRAVVHYNGFQQYDIEVKDQYLFNVFTLKATARQLAITWDLGKRFSCRSSLSSTTKVNIASSYLINSESCFHSSLTNQNDFQFCIKI